MNQSHAPKARPTVMGIPYWEFIALTAALMALNALAIDIMIPALQQIGASLGVVDENHRQFVITAYIVGFGAAQLCFGPLSDAFGRRKPLIAGLVIYVAAACGAAFAPSFVAILLLRFVQGIGAAATRVIAISVIRDCFGGRRMAEIMSLVFMVFMAVPVVAPGLGQFIMLFASWHWIFIAMGAGALLTAIWSIFRLPETLAPENTRPFTIAAVTEGFYIVCSNRVALCYTLACMATFSALFGFITSAQQIYMEVYDLGNLFGFVFAGIAGMMSLSNFLNSRLVGRFGMRRLAHGAMFAFIAVCCIWFVASVATTHLPFVPFLVLFTTVMFLFGFIGSNFNALAMEPLGHVAGTASSVLGFAQTFGGGINGTMIGQSFDGTVTPIAAGFCVVSFIALGLVLIAERGRLFQPHNPRL
jgi:DHA1 family bicyclomycin/chloramphenicol resistance-like MFS transporter